eukprot:8141766-Lingulodinium_polyedra.AAC.1
MEACLEKGRAAGSWMNGRVPDSLRTFTALSARRSCDSQPPQLTRTGLHSCGLGKTLAQVHRARIAFTAS